MDNRERDDLYTGLTEIGKTQAMVGRIPWIRIIWPRVGSPNI